jgi:hypothetical protein
MNNDINIFEILKGDVPDIFPDSQNSNRIREECTVSVKEEGIHSDDVVASSLQGRPHH